MNNLASMVDLARAAGIRVVLASVLPVTDEKGLDGTPINRYPSPATGNLSARSTAGWPLWPGATATSTSITSRRARR